MKVLKSVNRHLEYIYSHSYSYTCTYSSPETYTYPDILGIKHIKKVEHKLTSKKITDIHADTFGMKLGKWFINYYHLTVKVKKNNDTYTVLMSNYVSDVAYEA